MSTEQSTNQTPRKTIWKFSLLSRIGVVQEMLLPLGSMPVKVELEPNPAQRIDRKTGKEKVVIWVEVDQNELRPATHAFALLHTGDEIPNYGQEPNPIYPMGYMGTIFANSEKSEVIHVYQHFPPYEPNVNPVEDSGSWGLIGHPETVEAV